MRRGLLLDISYYDLAAKIDVIVGGNSQGSYTLGLGTIQTVSYSKTKGGYVVIKSAYGTDIIASMTSLRRSDIIVNTWTGIAQTMGLQEENLSNQYFPPVHQYRSSQV